MADSGKAEILAVVSCNQHELTGPSLDVVNTYFGKPGIPLGAPKSKAVSLGAWQHWPDTLVDNYPHKVRKTSDLPDAVDVYRRELYHQPDTSVTIVTVGFLTNLADLLRSEADSICPLSGPDLISRKVKKLVSMAGRFPEGKEFNVHMDSAASAFVFDNWPTPVIFTGFEIGWEIRTGLRLIEMDVQRNPVKDVFSMCIPMAEEDRNGRMSWDETAVLIAVYGTKSFFKEVTGEIVIHPDGSNGWISDPAGNHAYVLQDLPVGQMSRFIEDRMMHIPKP
jgi:inosine-uridine nucleoside N-ribohydrolase